MRWSFPKQRVLVQVLSQMLAFARGTEEATKYVKELGLQLRMDIARYVAIASEVMAKNSS